MVKKSKRVTIKNNKPIFFLKERMKYGTKNELCPFCVMHGVYLQYYGYHKDIYECIFAQSAYKNKIRFKYFTPLIAGDIPADELSNYWRALIPEGGSPCLKADWAQCPYNTANAK